MTKPKTDEETDPGCSPIPYSAINKNKYGRQMGRWLSTYMTGFFISKWPIIEILEDAGLCAEW